MKQNLLEILTKIAKDAGKLVMEVYNEDDFEIKIRMIILH